MMGEQNELGDILDVPFIASHSNAREVTAHRRNLPDHLIRLIGEKGGVIGLNFAQSFLGTSSISRIDDIVKHGLYIINKGGEDVIALGTDLMVSSQIQKLRIFQICIVCMMHFEAPGFQKNKRKNYFGKTRIAY